MDLLVVSDCVLDVFMPASFPLKANSVVVANSPCVISPGGSCYVAVTAKRLGLSVRVIDAFGEDWQARIILDTLEREGVDVRYVTKNSTSTCVVLLGKKRHSFVGTFGGGLEKIEHTKSVKSVFFSGYLLHPLNPNRVVLKHIQQAHEEGKIVFFDLAPVKTKKEELLSALSVSDLVFANLREFYNARKILGVHSDILKKKTVILKLGKEGCAIVQGENTKKFGALEVKKPVCDVGAGDVFDGAFIACHLKGLTLDECAIVANTAAALKLEGIGIQSVPPREAILHRLPRDIKNVRKLLEN